MTQGRPGTRWLVLVGVLVVGYFIAAPVLNQQLGWNLPVVAAEDEQPTSRDVPAPQHETNQQRPGTQKKSIRDAKLEAIAAGQSSEVYTSPAGLRYTRSRADGHRIRHVMLHARNEPNRPGPHGVFDANEPAEVIALIDEAYQQALRGEQTKKTNEANGIRYDVNMGRRIGYVGGQKGARSRPPNPPATKLRLIVNDDRLITAFPIR